MPPKLPKKEQKPAASDFSLPPSMHAQMESDPLRHGGQEEDEQSNSSDDGGSIESISLSESGTAETIVRHAASHPINIDNHGQHALNANDEASARATIEALLSSNESAAPNVAGSSPATEQSNNMAAAAINTELILRLLDKMTMQTQLHLQPKKRLRLKDEERRLAIEPNKLNRNAQLVELKEWEQSIRNLH